MITFYADNLLDQATVTADDENALFPLSNIKDPRRTKVFRSQGNTVDLLFDFMETSDVDSVVMVDNPRSGFGISTVLIQMNGTNSWGAPAFSTTMTLNTKHGVGILELPAIQSYRFMKITLTSTLGYCELANIFIGAKTVTSRGISYGWTYKDEDISTVKENRYAQKFVDLIGRQKDFSAGMMNLTKEDLEKIFLLYDSKGKSHPFFVKLGCPEAVTEVERYTTMVYFKTVPSISNRFFDNYSMSIQLEEAK